MPTSCSLLILSTDRYADLWPLCTTLHRKYWPDCPWPRFIGSDTVPGSINGFISLGTGQKGLPWADSLQRILAQIDTQTILLMLDDFFLTGLVNTDRIVSLLDVMERHNAAYLRLVPHKRFMCSISTEKYIGEHQRGLPYRASLQAAFWNTRVLKELLVPSENPWQFELYAGLRSDLRKEPFLATYDQPLPYIDVLERGKWLPRGLRLCHKEGLRVDLGVRSRTTYRDMLRRIRTQILSWPLELMPINLRRKVRYHKNQSYRNLF